MLVHLLLQGKIVVFSFASSEIYIWVNLIKQFLTILTIQVSWLRQWWDVVDPVLTRLWKLSQDTRKKVGKGEGGLLTLLFNKASLSLRKSNECCWALKVYSRRFQFWCLTLFPMGNSVLLHFSQLFWQENFLECNNLFDSIFMQPKNFTTRIYLEKTICLGGPCSKACFRL